MTSFHMTRRNSQNGVTLLESLIAMAVSAVVLGAAVPEFEAARERRHLEGTVAQLETDLQYARSLAVAGNQTLRMSFGTNPTGSCYTISGAAATDVSCQQTGLRLVQLPPDHLSLSASAASMAFDPTRGTVTPTSTVEVNDAPAVASYVDAQTMRVTIPQALVRTEGTIRIVVVNPDVRSVAYSLRVVSDLPVITSAGIVHSRLSRPGR